jgi:hypothetical protein
MNRKAESTTKFQFLEAYLVVNRIRPYPSYLISTTPLWLKEVLLDAMWQVSNPRLIFSARPKYLATGNVVLGQLPKRLLFSMVKNKDTLLDTNPSYFGLFDLAI